MSKAEEIVSQAAEPKQIRRWAEGNAIEREFVGSHFMFLYEDGSMICGRGYDLISYP